MKKNSIHVHKTGPWYLLEALFNGVNSGDQTDIAEMLNSFFTEIGPSLGRNLTEFLTETDQNFVFEKNSTCTCFLSKSKATGLVNISANLLRECPDLLAESLTHIFNQALMTGIFPDEWKYLPESLQCIKIVESALIRRIIDQYQ